MTTCLAVAGTGLARPVLGMRGCCVFLACSFWLVDALHAIGRDSEAVELVERLLDLRNDVGLFSEEWDPKARRQLGNIPQSFSPPSPSSKYPEQFRRDAVDLVRAFGRGAMVGCP